MKAVVTYDFNESAVEDVPKPEPGPGEALIEVDRVQLSVTECNLYRGEAIRHVDEVSARLEGGDGARLFGHEFCGRVEAVGDGVDSVAPGDRVYAPGKIPCFDCSYCDAGHENLCRNKEGLGYEYPGALAEYFTAPAYPLETLPEGVSDAEGAAMQPFASSVVCVHDADVQTGDVVAVFGVGVMGNQCAQLAFEEGAGEVYAVDVVDEKLELAEERGMVPIDATEEDAAERILEETDGVGADIAIEAAGGPQDSMTEGNDPIAGAYRSVREAGQILQVGHIIGDDFTLRPRSLRGKSVTWRHPRRGVISTGPNTTTGELAPRLVADGRVSIEEYTTHELDGLGSFEEMVDITLNKAEHGALGPAQIVVS